MDVFRGQMTEEITNLLKNKNIFFLNVPNNMTHLFQLLSLTVNGHCKKYMKDKFTEWYFEQVVIAFCTGVTVEGINIQYELTTI